MVTVTIPVFLFCGILTTEGKNITYASSLENINDPMLQVEEWMTNDVYWFNSGTVESALGIESWMTDENNWYSGDSGFDTVVEEKIVLESWMTDEKNWNQGVDSNKADGTLEVEPWMTLDEYWNVR